MAVPLQSPYAQFFDDNGDPLAGGLVYTYVAGTTTNKATYTDATEVTQASNPIVLDSAGRAAIWIVGTYRFDVKTAAGVLIRSVDAVPAYTAGGDMTKAVYDPANIAQQLVGTTAVQQLTNKTLLQPNIVGTTTNDDAAAGSVGEYIEATRVFGSALALTSGSALTVTSISLTAGDWDVQGLVQFTSGGTTTTTLMEGVISLINNSATPSGVNAVHRQNSTGIGTNPGHWLPVGSTRIKVSSTTTVYLVANSTFASSTMSAYGQISARRRR